MPGILRQAALLFLFAGLVPLAEGSTLLDFRQAAVVRPADLNRQEQTAVRVLVEEIERQTLIKLPVLAEWPGADVPVIAVGPRTSVAQWGGAFASSAADPVESPGAEGFSLVVDRTRRAAPAVLVVGNDSRGVLFGIGRLLRELRMERGRLEVPAELRLSTAPRVALRGHQLGYRPKTNSYDGWDVPVWDQYIRDLAIFGTNAIELIPPRSDDAPDSPHFPRPQMDMMVEMSRIADDYGLDVWIWYPALDKDYGEPGLVDFALQEWEGVFEKLPRIDAVFVPGGDPGHTQPKHLMALLEKQTANLRRHHPRAQMWVSPQGFTKEWMDEFYGILRQEPAWLSGIVFGPQVRDSLPVLRANVPKRYPIRRYPDITHSLRSQYPVPNWDLAHALTSEREPINPRPMDQASVFRALQQYADGGFLTYSEGCNDDVNKMIWSVLGWDPHADVREALRQYSRFFIGLRYTDTFTDGLLALERNWRGPLKTNEGVYTTLQQFQELERRATPHDLLNWRFQQALYRAYYDAYQRSRLLYETDLEERAMDRLRAARQIGTARAMDEAETILARSDLEKPSPEWRLRIFQLAEALFQSIRMQLSVERYQAISVGRGATLDMVDRPLNNRVWLREQFAGIRSLAEEPQRLAEIDRIVNWTDPGPGGFYDDLGNPSRQPHLLRGAGFEQDPGSFDSVSVGFGYRPNWRLSWMRHAESFYDAPLRMRYTGLDPEAAYRLRVVYAGDVFSFRNHIRLTANDGLEVHPFLPKELPIRPMEFDVPREATRGGELTLTWEQEPGRGGAGRGNQIAEVWLMRVRDGAESAVESRR
jgi:hypothetical protein